jgi:hypothetical protein
LFSRFHAISRYAPELSRCAFLRENTLEFHLTRPVAAIFQRKGKILMPSVLPTEEKIFEISSLFGF